MNTFWRIRFDVILSAFSIFLTVLLAGCGGGGGGSGAAQSSNPTIVSGVASKGLLNGSTVCAYAITGGAKGTQIGSCTTTDASGNYQINLGAYTGPVLFVATGGTYVNEATGTIVNLTSPLDSMLSNSTGGNVTVAITALTEVAYQIANASSGELTSANILSAIASVQNNFGVTDIIHTVPIDALNVPAGATAAQKNYALALSTISQYLNGQPAGVTLATALQTMQACFAAPTTGCGNGNAQVGALMSSALNTFIASHPTFSGMNSLLAHFGSTPNTGSITLVTVNPLKDATVGVAYAQSVVQSTTPASTYTYSIDTLANGNGVPTGMTLNMAGVLSGTPFATGATNVNGFQIAHAYTFGVCATDTVSRTETTPCQQTQITVQPLQLTVTLAGTGSGTVTPSSAGNSCGANCYSGYASGSSVTLTATPSTGSTFTGWSGGGCSGTGTCVVTMSTSQTVTATFGGSSPLTGTWVGTWAWSGTGSNGCTNFSDGGSFSMTLTQTGTSFSGSVSAAGIQTRDNATCALMSTGTGSGSASGTISGTTLSLSFNPNGGSATLDFTGTATLNANANPNTLTANFVRDTGGSGSFSLTKQ
jgi:hypothetical protein